MKNTWDSSPLRSIADTPTLFAVGNITIPFVGRSQTNTTAPLVKSGQASITVPSGGSDQTNTSNVTSHHRKVIVITYPLDPIAPRAFSGDKNYCKKMVPGLNRMAQGIDIAKLDLFPPDITSPSGFLRPIFGYSCAVERKWYDPMDPSEEYDIPDQVESVIPVPTGSLNIKTSSNENTKQFKN